MSYNVGAVLRGRIKDNLERIERMRATIANREKAIRELEENNASLKESILKLEGLSCRES